MTHVGWFDVEFVYLIYRWCENVTGYHYQFCTIHIQFFSIVFHTAPSRVRVELLAKPMCMSLSLATANRDYSSCKYSFLNLDLLYILLLFSVFTNILIDCINFYITIINIYYYNYIYLI